MARNYRYVIETLSVKHARLQGVVARNCPNNAGFMADMEAVERVIRIYFPDWQPLPPINPRGPAIMGSYGVMIRGALDVLRTADRPLTTMEIARAVAGKSGLTEFSHVKAAAASIHMGLKRRVSKGVVIVDGHPKRWALEGRQ